MLLSKNAIVEITKKVQIKYYFKKYNIKCEIGNFILIPIKNLTLGSHILVKVKCDNCGCEKEIRYQTYNHNTNNQTEYYYCSNVECMKIKRIQSIKIKYEVNNVFQLKEVKNKIIKTNLEKYDVDNPQKNKLIKEKTEKTNLRIYGFKNVFQNEDIKEKIKKTNLERYRVEYIMQNSNFFIKSIKTSHKINFFKNTDIYYQGSYELDFLNNYYKLFPNIENGKSFEYIFNNKNKVYHSDFFIPSKNLIIEIKNSYLLKRDKDKIIEKEKAVKLNGYNYILILDKDYTEFNTLFS